MNHTNHVRRQLRHTLPCQPANINVSVLFVALQERAVIDQIDTQTNHDESNAELSSNCTTESESVSDPNGVVRFC